MIAIKNATLVMRDHLIPEAVLFIEDGIIAGFGGIAAACEHCGHHQGSHQNCKYLFHNRYLLFLLANHPIMPGL